MKINNKRNKIVSFGSIKEGEVFIMHNEDICMRTESTYCDNNGDYENAVNLANGNLIFCSDNLMVCPIKCELVIE